MRDGQRVVALDALRGLAVAGMILVTSPGDWVATYPWLRHADWNGATAADMVFPAFLFAVGMAVGLSFPRAPDAPPLWPRALRRVVALILIGLVVEATYNLAIALGAPFLGQGDIAHLRLPGVLQRIAFCYIAALAVTLATARRAPDRARIARPGAIALIALALLVGYWLLLGLGGLTASTSLEGIVDRAVFGVPHLWPLGWEVPGGPVYYDPEGIVSTIGATCNALFGVLAGIARRRMPGRGPAIIALAGAAMFAAGLLLDPLLVINKRIWTSSFALLSGGVAAMLFGAFSAVLRDPLALRLAAPLRVLGGNAILAFVLSQLFGRLYCFPFGDGPTGTPQGWLDHAALGLVGDPYIASLACALLILALITLLIWPLHRRAIHFRV